MVEPLSTKLPQLFSSLQKTTQSVQALPEGSDFIYWETHSEFRQSIEVCQGRLVAMLQRLMKFAEPGSEHVTFDSVTDAADSALELVDLQLASEVDNTPSLGLSKLSLYELPKPQDQFRMPIDNSTAPFQPKLLQKLYARRPLDLKLVLGEYEHPYKAELEQLEWSAAMLTAPCESSFLSLEDTPYSYVRDTRAFAEMLAELEGAEELALDLEHHNFRSYQGFTCLVQLSTRSKDYVIDALALRDDLQALDRWLCNPHVVKVLHGADYDIEWLQKDFGLYIVNLFDTFQAASELVLPSKGLGALLKQVCGVTTDKKYQLADWRLRPLPLEMEKYARMDTHYLLHIYDRLRQDLARKAKENNYSSDSLIRKVFQASCRVSARTFVKLNLKWSGFTRTLAAFDKGQMKVLEALAEWRDATARMLDESPAYVLPHGLMKGLVFDPPSTLESLVARLQKKAPVAQQHSKQLFALLEAAPLTVLLPAVVEAAPLVYSPPPVPQVVFQTYSLCRFPVTQTKPSLKTLGVLSNFQDFSVVHVPASCMKEDRIVPQPSQPQDDIIPLSSLHSLQQKQPKKSRKVKLLQDNPPQLKTFELEPVHRSERKSYVKRRNLFKR
jgi:exosome complex exonuclease RRP6